MRTAVEDARASLGRKGNARIGFALRATTALLWLAFAGSAQAGQASDMVLVADGQARCAVVLDKGASAAVRLAAREFTYHIQRSSGAAIPTVSPADAAALPKETVRVVIGANALTRSLGVKTDDLPPEAYRVKTVGRHVVFVGHDLGEFVVSPKAGVPCSTATLWAVCHVLDRHFGVRWLWPGDVGTYVPRRRTIALPAMDVTGRPDLEQRRMRTNHALRERKGGLKMLSDEAFARLVEESQAWKHRHMMGRRTTYRFGHAFKQWWARYHEQQPDLFAKLPDGRKQPRPRAERVKLCVSNPAVAETIVKEWVAAGKPDNWNVCPNDGSAFCVCAACRALDAGGARAAGQGGASGVPNLTGRYVTLWNILMRRMRPLNPNVTVSSYAYSAYREPPACCKLEPGIVLGMVHSYRAFEPWRKWHEVGARLFLRPNWWHMGACAPHIPLHSMGKYFRFARSHSMIGFDMDSLLGYWGTQGPNYYLAARLSARPDLTTDDVIAEYASAFGPAASAVKRYLAYWEAFTEKAALVVPAGGCVSQDPNGLYETVCREHGLNPHPLLGSYLAMPALYTDAVLAPAYAILDEATRLAGSSDERVRARVRFLRDGLDHMKASRDLIGLANRKPTGEARRRLLDGVRSLYKLRRELSPRHVVWAEPAAYSDVRRRVFRAARVKAAELEGM